MTQAQGLRGAAVFPSPVAGPGGRHGTHGSGPMSSPCWPFSSRQVNPAGRPGEAMPMSVQELVGGTEASHGQECRPAALPGQLSRRARASEATVSAVGEEPPRLFGENQPVPALLLVPDAPCSPECWEQTPLSPSPLPGSVWWRSRLCPAPSGVQAQPCKLKPPPSLLSALPLLLYLHPGCWAGSLDHPRLLLLHLLPLRASTHLLAPRSCQSAALCVL